MAIAATSAKFRKTGDTLDYTPASAVNAGDIIVVDGLVCIAQWDIPANTPGVLKVLHRGEVVEVTTDEAIGSTNVGTAIYVVAATGLVTKTSTSNVLLGYARAAVGSTDLTFEVVCA
jgi:predicted RecA/RadA family phage recombinase